MNLNHQLNPIYTPQGVSLVGMMTFKLPALRHSSVLDHSPAQQERITKMQDAAMVSLKERTDERYAKAFGGQPRTASELAKAIGISRQGTQQQLRKYAKTGEVLRGNSEGNKEVLWSWKCQ